MTVLIFLAGLATGMLIMGLSGILDIIPEDE